MPQSGASNVARLVGEARRQEEARPPNQLEAGSDGHCPWTLANVIEAAPEPVVVLDGSAKLLWSNALARNLLGINAQGDDMGHVVVRRLDDSPWPTADLPLTRALGDGGMTRAVQMRFVRADMGVVTVLASASPIRDENGRLAGAVAMFHDISDLIGSPAEHERDPATVLHDLRHPLTAIKGHVQLVERNILHAPRLNRAHLAQGLNRANASIRRMEEQLQGLVDSRSQQPTLHLQKTDLSPLVRETVDDFLVSMDGDRPDVDVVAWSQLLVHVDAVQVRRVLWNLLSNAAKYGGLRSRIRVVTEARITSGRRFVAVSVQDFGPGIPPDDLPHIFERFYRGANRHSADGHGIGLYSSKQIVEEHGGWIEVASAPQEGSRFTVLLPAD